MKRMWIDGAFSDAQRELDDILDPTTETVIARVPVGTHDDVDAAVVAAKGAFQSIWCDTTPGERSNLLHQFANHLEQHNEELAALEKLNTGKPIGVARGDVEFAVDNLRFFAGAARMLQGLAAAEYNRGSTSFTRREPLGVVAGIAPWNYPLLMMIWKIAPALAAGNSVQRRINLYALDTCQQTSHEPHQPRTANPPALSSSSAVPPTEQHLTLEINHARNPPIQALPRERTQLDLRDIQPA